MPDTLILFQTINWTTIPKTIHPGENGVKLLIIDGDFLRPLSAED